MNPWFSYIDNIGQDGTGTHYKKSLAKNLKQEINQDGIFFPVKDIKEDKNALKIMKYHYKKNKLDYLKYFFKKAKQENDK